MAERLDTEIFQFHQHLENCERCREQPFNLCSDGQHLLFACAAIDLRERPIRHGRVSDDDQGHDYDRLRE